MVSSDDGVESVHGADDRLDDDTIQAIAAGNGYLPSGASIGIYKIAALAPTFLAESLHVQHAAICGPGRRNPRGDDLLHNRRVNTHHRVSQDVGPITVSSTTTIQAIAAGNGYAAGGTSMGIYAITAVSPTFSPNPGSYTTTQTVTLADATPGVTIYYTTDGSTPTTASKPYTGPITVSTATTIRPSPPETGMRPAGSAWASTSFRL